MEKEFTVLFNGVRDENFSYGVIFRTKLKYKGVLIIGRFKKGTTEPNGFC